MTSKPPAKRTITTCPTCAAVTIPATTPSGTKVVVDYNTSPRGGIALSPGARPAALVIAPDRACPPGHTRHTLHEMTCERPHKRQPPAKRPKAVPFNHPTLFDGTSC